MQTHFAFPAFPHGFLQTAPSIPIVSGFKELFLGSSTSSETPPRAAELHAELRSSTPLRSFDLPNFPRVCGRRETRTRFLNPAPIPSSLKSLSLGVRVLELADRGAPEQPEKAQVVVVVKEGLRGGTEDEECIPEDEE